MSKLYVVKTEGGYFPAEYENAGVDRGEFVTHNIHEAEIYHTSDMTHVLRYIEDSGYSTPVAQEIRIVEVE